MTRKLFSLLMSSVALVLLMGAGVEQGTPVLTEEDGEEAPQAAIQTSAEVRAEPVPAAAGASVLSMVEELDSTLTVDGHPVTKDVAKTYCGQTTYVALVPMAQCLDSSVTSAWDAGSQTMTVTSSKLNLTAAVGQLYLTANGRYLYAPEGVQMADGQVMVPLAVLTEAFGASLTWDAATGITAVTCGSGGAVSGDQYYNADDLYWLDKGRSIEQFSWTVQYSYPHLMGESLDVSGFLSSHV